MKQENKEVTHKVAGKVHNGPKDRCIFCHGWQGGVIGEKTGGKW